MSSVTLFAWISIFVSMATAARTTNAYARLSSQPDTRVEAQRTNERGPAFTPVPVCPCLGIARQRQAAQSIFNPPRTPRTKNEIRKRNTHILQ